MEEERSEKNRLLKKVEDLNAEIQALKKAKDHKDSKLKDQL